ncbi:hypothetical protein K435DRAFT_729245 [Dendrothele bispora CBS 962.96]|uniref:Glycosyltransferase family 32 protein n=1 Tax=Dendrothele bispora (strain CBS 962.96) TaxID=1314807 RepID=A0A4S8LK92_DENBC|nr:hypothetical protein K435DRAFT_729245 [Dendrothele bispora CBS 962.96]
MSLHLRNPSYPANSRGTRQSEYLPKYLPSEKKTRRHDSSFSLLKFPLKILRWFHSRFGRKRGSFLVFLTYVAIIFTVFALAQRFGSRRRSWPGSTTSPTLVYRREDIQRIWGWEIASGHHPSTRPVSSQLGFEKLPQNPALDNGIGPRRTYRVHSSQPPNVAYPPRPAPGSIADLDRIMPHCDFNLNKYVRDCLEVLRVGAGLDSGKRVRRTIPQDWKYVYVEDPFTTNSTHTAPLPVKNYGGVVRGEHEAEATFTKNRRAPWEPSPIQLPPIKYPTQRSTGSCDPEQPRIFHMFWTGDFTDKPYIALLSFLYTQNLGLDKDTPSTSPCTPKLWLWINPGFVVTQHYPAVSVQMFESIKSSPWATPFLHPRFKNLIEFKLWNTTEQLEATPELKDDWRSLSTLFNSGGDIIRMPTLPKSWPSHIPFPSKQKDSGGEYKGERETDKISVVLSDMARFLLCHRYGGVYLDADTLFLRDWEELWNWKGAFAYRWSWHPAYNTAILRMHKGSALGTFLLRTSLKNDFDFHPMTITKYLEEAKMEELLYRLPDALFDSAWLNMEGYQRDRPAQPPYSRFAEFFDTAAVDSATPAVVGFDGFFKGAFSYHFHNSWAMLADPGRNFPDLGPKFSSSSPSSKEGVTSWKEPKEEDRRDLSWSTVLKRSFEAYLRGEAPNMYGEWLAW